MNKKIILVGDSITEAFNEKSYLPGLNVTNYGVSGDSTVETLNRIDINWFSYKPDIAFLCIGTNDFARYRSDEFILGNISKIIDKIMLLSPGTLIIPTSIFPTRDNLPRPNERIRNFNNSLEELVLSRNLNFFNIHDNFTDEQDQLKSEFTEDGLHLTSGAYKLWAELIINFLENNSYFI